MPNNTAHEHRTWRAFLALICAPLITVTALAWSAPVAASATGTAARSAPAAEGEDSKMMLVMDSSGSMKEPAAGGMTKIQAAKESLNAVIGGMPDDQNVGLRVYGSEVFEAGMPGACTDSERVVDIGSDNRDELSAAVESYKPYGETPIGYALEEAGKDLGEEGKRTIVLVSDGESTCQPPPCEVAQELHKQGIDLKIDVVGLDVNSAAREELACIAEKGGGTYFDAESADELTEALETLATRALRPYETTGQPVEGTPEPADAPTISAGDYTDTLGSYDNRDGAGDGTGTRYYTIERQIEGSTIHATASLTNSGYEAAWVGLDASGTECGTGNGSVVAGDMPLVSAYANTTLGQETDPKGPCSDDTVTLRVERGLKDLGETYSPSEDSLPVEIRIIEEPPLEDPGATPKAPGGVSDAIPEVGTGGEKIVGGTSFADAPVIEPGDYTGGMVPGEMQLFAVDVDWGQRLIAAADFPRTGELDEESSQFDNINIQVFSPQRSAANIKAGPDRDALIGNSGISGLTKPVAYNNRGAGTYDTGAGSSLAGQYYVGLSIAPDDEVKPHGVINPYNLTIEVAGEPSGEPAYTEETGGNASGEDSESDAEDPDSGAPTEETDDGSTESGDVDEKAAESDDDGGSGLPIILAVGGAAALIAAGYILMKSRRAA